MNDTKTKKQIADKIKDSTNVLVALNSNPTVDELSAALGVTLAINKIDKHATAVFSGQIPAAIEFLEPEKTFENTVASLQDFIIALDKEKADHLRYKVDGDMVKIFITPYRTTIDESDLEFSQGDYNVDLVLAIGVQAEESLDKALRSHGQILHDATVASISLDESSGLGTINWNDKNASSYCELLASLVKELGDIDLLDEQIATALLTGIVAATDRFSNAKTSSRVMTVAADLMSAGANQQLIAVQLEQAEEISGSDEESEAEEVPEEPAVAPAPEEKQGSANGELSISHEFKGDVDEVAEQVAEQHQEEATKAAEDELAKQLDAQGAESAPSVPPADLLGEAKAVDYEETPLRGAAQQDAWKAPSEPALGGTLNATTEEAANEKRQEESDTQNHKILSHDAGHYIAGESPSQTPLSAATAGQTDEPEVRDIFADNSPAPNLSTLPPLPSMQAPVTPAPVAEPVTTPSGAPTLAAIDAANRAPSHEQALNDVHAALGAQPPQANPAAGGVLPGLPPLPPMPDFSTLPPLPATQLSASDPNPFDTGVSTIPPEPLGSTLPPTPPAPEPGKADPGQFKIPGQN